jgi:hypothetical protein
MNVTILGYGSIETDPHTKPKEYGVPYSRWKSDSFTLPGNTKSVAIEGFNYPNTRGGIFASFSNGVVTDKSWHCAETTCTGESWRKSTTKVHRLLAPEKKYIWVENDTAPRVWCNKTFGKSKIFKNASSYIFLEIFHLKQCMSTIS